MIENWGRFTTKSIALWGEGNGQQFFMYQGSLRFGRHASVGTEGKYLG
jgi:hypothetical protein